MAEFESQQTSLEDIIEWLPSAAQTPADLVIKIASLGFWCVLVLAIMHAFRLANPTKRMLLLQYSKIKQLPLPISDSEQPDYAGWFSSRINWANIRCMLASKTAILAYLSVVSFVIIGIINQDNQIAALAYALLLFMIWLVWYEIKFLVMLWQRQRYWSAAKKWKKHTG